MLGVLYVDSVVVLSVCKRFPPVEASYHLIIPATELEAAMVTDPGPHLEPVIAVGADAVGRTVATTGTRSLVHAGEAVTNST